MPAPELGDRLASEHQRLLLLMHHLAGRAVRNRVEPEDLVQEVFVRALGAPGQVPPSEVGEAGLRRWLNTLARRVVIDVARALRAARRDGREAPLVRSDWSVAGVAESQLGAPGPGPATRVEGAETAQQLVTAYRALAPDQRRVLGLRQFEGLSARETGQRMGRSESAVHSLYRRALEAWQAGLE